MPHTMTRPLLWAMLLASTAAAASMVRVPPSSEPYVVGAYYYGWYDSRHWAAFDYLGPHLPEPLEPALGEYDSMDPAVARAHVQWAADFGIDFLIVSWSGRDTTADRQAREVLMPQLAQSAVRQAPVIELLHYREAYGALDLSNSAFREQLAADVRYVSEHYLRHSSAMRIDGRPVLFLYLTRELQGELSSWLNGLRFQLEATGVDPFIVADEVFWQEVDRTRLGSFDAITAYNVYDWPLTRHRGYASQSTFFADVEELFREWRDAAEEAGAAFVPNAMPGYNDRGVRLAEDHYVIPRQARPAGPYTGFFERSIDLAKRFADPDLRMITITSFNEWHEWTAIAPTRPTQGRPSEPEPLAYTQGFPHPPYGLEFLEVVRERLGSR